MLDNMSIETLNTTLVLIPQNIITEVSGGITLKNIKSFTIHNKHKTNYIPVGCITNSTPSSDFSMYIKRK